MNRLLSLLLITAPLAFVACSKKDAKAPASSETAGKAQTAPPAAPTKLVDPAPPQQVRLAPSKRTPAPSLTPKKALTNPEMVAQLLTAAAKKMKTGDEAGAIRFYSQAMRIDPESGVPFQRLCVHYGKTQPKLALPHCREWLQRETHAETKSGIETILVELKARIAKK